MCDVAYQLADQFGATLSSQMTVDGLRLNTFGKLPSEIVANFRSIKHLRIRDDDVLLCSYPKSGTHWTFQMVSMLLNGSSDIGSRQHIPFLATTTPEEAEKIPSPRILNTHIPYERLPVQVKQKKTKIVLCLRNPKDQVVSYYNYHLGMKRFNYTGTFSGHLRWFMEDKLEYGSWFDYVLGYEKAMELKEVPIHLVYYEDLKENGLDEIRKLVRFLEVSADDNLCAAIHDKVQFDNMKTTMECDKHFADLEFKPGCSFFRKGMIGDWKNFFTVAESEEFDRLFGNKMKTSNLKFRFTPSIPSESVCCDTRTFL